MDGKFGTAPLPASADNLSNEEAAELIAMGADIIRQMHCAEETQDFSSCVESNRMTSDPEGAANGPCRRQFSALRNAAQRVSQEAIIQGMLGVGGDACERQLRTFEQCAEQNGPERCEQQFVNALACSALSVLKKVEQFQ
mmetsp:Transcript_11078/g.45180  ORF Transcript_11078/g.45180 Transcript_11078/m.45180 type:complete len:140 (+) Transcript_11078:38-457(+)